MIVQKGSHRLIHFEDDSDPEEQENQCKIKENQMNFEPKIILKNNQNAIKIASRDKFQISQIQRGMFLYHNQEEEYRTKYKKQPQKNDFNSQLKIQAGKKKQPKKEIELKANKNMNFQYKDQHNEVQNDLCQEITFGIKDKNQELSQQVTSKSTNKMLEVQFSDQQDEQENKTTEDKHNVFKQQQCSSQQEEQEKNEDGEDDQIDSIDERMNQIMNEKNKKTVDISNIENIQLFVRVPIEKKHILRAVVSRDTSGLNMFGPLYHLMASGIMKTILWSKKIAMSSSANYNFSLLQDCFGGANQYNVGKSTSNFVGSNFNVYENFYNSKTKTKTKQLRATIVYNNQLLSNTPRKFQVFLINGNYSYSSLEGVTPQLEYSINDLYHIESNKQKIEVFSNREPLWNQKLKGYILNFNGRIDKASIKNFILQRPQTKEEVLMFGKAGQDLYNICISHPLSPFMGLAIALTHFDNKFLYQ